MGSTVRFTVFNSQNAQSAIHGWRAKAVKRAHEKTRHAPLAPHLANVIGLHKPEDKQVHIQGIELLHHTKAHNKETIKDPNHQHSHPELLPSKPRLHQGKHLTILFLYLSMRFLILFYAQLTFSTIILNTL